MPNSNEGANVPLTIFGGLVNDIDPIDLPAGASPANENATYAPGKVGTRPALKKVYSPALPAEATFIKTYVKQDGTPTTLVADADGNLYQELVETAPGEYALITNDPPPVVPIASDPVTIPDGITGYDFGGNSPYSEFAFEYNGYQYAFITQEGFGPGGEGDAQSDADGKTHAMFSADGGTNWAELDADNAPNFGGTDIVATYTVARDGSTVILVATRNYADETVIAGLQVITFDLTTNRWGTATNYSQPAIALTITARTMPWADDATTNYDDFTYGKQDGFSPAVLPGLVAGQTVTFTYVSGTVTADTGGTATDPDGDQDDITGDTTGVDDVFFPTKYMDNASSLGRGGLCGAFVDDDGTMVKAVAIGKSVTLTVPTGATKMWLGINNDSYQNATGFYSMSISVSGNAMPQIDYVRFHWTFLQLMVRGANDYILYYSGPREASQARCYYATFDGTTFGTGVALPDQSSDDYTPSPGVIDSNGNTHFFYSTSTDLYHVARDSSDNWGTSQLITDALVNFGIYSAASQPLEHDDKVSLVTSIYDDAEESSQSLRMYSCGIELTPTWTNSIITSNQTFNAYPDDAYLVPQPYAIGHSSGWLVAVWSVAKDGNFQGPFNWYWSYAKADTLEWSTPAIFSPSIDSKFDDDDQSRTTQVAIYPTATGLAVVLGWTSFDSYELTQFINIVTPPSTTNNPTLLPANTYVKSDSAFTREYMGFFNSSDPGGAAPPIIWDGKSLSRLTQDGPGSGVTLQEANLNVDITSITQPEPIGSVPDDIPVAVGDTTINFYHNSSGIYQRQGSRQSNITAYTGGNSLVFNQLNRNFPILGFYGSFSRSPMSQQQQDAVGNWTGDVFFPESDPQVDGEGHGFDCNIQTTLTFAEAGTYTLYILCDDTWVLFAGESSGGGTISYVSGPQNGSASSLAGYSYVAARNEDHADEDQSWDTVKITVSAAGTYPIEIGYSNWGAGPETTFQMTYATGSASVATGRGVVGSNILPAPVTGSVSCTANGQTITVVCPNNHPFGVGDTALLAGFDVDGFNGLQTITEVPSPNTFQFESTSSDLTSSSGGTVAPVTATVITDDPHGLLVGDGVTVSDNSEDVYNTGYVDTSVTPFIVNPALWTVKAVIDDKTFQVDMVQNAGTTGTGGTLGCGGLVSPGIHKCIVAFELEDGSITAPSPVAQWNSTGNKKVTVYSLPVGPPNTKARILAFTAAGGNNYFYLPVDVLGTQTTLGGNSSIVKIGTATRIPDNTTTTVTLDFSDASLLAGTAIDIPGNNLFAQVTLAPVQGVISYTDRLFVWGEWNKIQNFVNMNFSGGLSAGVPPGWTGNKGTGVLVSTDLQGYAWRITGDGTSDALGLISQSAYQDALNVPILAPSTRYRFRAFVRLSESTATGSLSVDLYQSSTSTTLAIGSVTLSSLAEGGAWVEAQFTEDTPATIPTDLLLRLYTTSVASDVDVDVSELMIIPDTQPVVGSQLRASYVDNPTAFDGVTGVLQVPSNGEAVVDCFVQDQVLYIATEKRLYKTSDNTATEPSGWAVDEVSNVAGAFSPRAATPGEEADFLVNKNGVYMARSGNIDHVSQEIAPTWDRINAAARRTIWATNDVKERMLYVGLPLDTAASPSHVLAMSYRSCRDGELPEPIRSNISGKLSTSDLVRKWGLWPIPSKDGAILQQGDGKHAFTLAATGNRNTYTFDGTRFTDDDFGQIASSYTTWFFLDDDTAEQMQIGSHRKLFAYLTCYASGVGKLKVTPYLDSLDNPGKSSRQLTLKSTTQYFDLEIPLNLKAERVAFKFEVVPAAGQTDAAFSLKKLVVTVKADTWSPIAGRI